MPIYMRYGTATKFIKGDVTEPAHKGWIELSQVDFVRIHDTRVFKKVDQASILVAQENKTGSITGEAVLDFVRFEKGKPQVILRVTLTSTLILEDSIDYGTAEFYRRHGQETVALGYREIRYGYSAGTITFRGVPPNIPSV